MQTQETYNVGRRPMDLEDYVDVLRRHKSWILGPLFAGVVIATVVACLWPDTYISSAVVRVTPPQVPDFLMITNNDEPTATMTRLPTRQDVDPRISDIKEQLIIEIVTR